MPSSLSLLLVLGAIALAIAGASLTAVALTAVVALLFEVYVSGSGGRGFS